MSLYRKVIHQGWVRKNDSEAKKSPARKIKLRGEQYLEVGPLVLECSHAGITEKDWLEIKSWMKQAAPYRGKRLQLLFIFGAHEQTKSKPLQLRLAHERVAISEEQRDRVAGTFRQHLTGNQPAKLKVMLRQNMRLA